MTIGLAGGTLIDGTGADPRSGAHVLVDGDRIAAVGDPHRADLVLDVSGLTVLPGLIDAHAHVGAVSDGELDLAAAVTAARVFHNCALALDAGFTTLRDTGGIDGGVVRAIEEGFVRGPRILPSGPFICQTGGHAWPLAPFSLHDHGGAETGLPGLVPGTVSCDGPDAVRAAARRALTRGATQLKVSVTGGLISVGNDLREHTQFTVAELAAAVEEAAARDTYVTAHAHTVAGIQLALEAGVGCIEHGTFLDEPTAAAMAAAGVPLVATLSVVELIRELELDDAAAARLAGADAAMAEAVKIAREAGVTIGSGSDHLGSGQDRRGFEIEIRARTEDPMSAIVAATRSNAAIIRRSGDLGTVEAGKVADLIAIDGDPLTDPAMFDDPNRVKLVVKGGAVVKDVLSAT